MVKYTGKLDDARAVRAFAEKHLPENYDEMEAKEEPAMMDAAMRAKMSKMTPEEMRAHMDSEEMRAAKERCEGSADHCGEGVMSEMPAKPGMRAAKAY